MKQDRTAAWAGAVCLLVWLAGAPLVAQEPQSPSAEAGMTGATDAVAAPPADSVVPRLVRFTGTIDRKLVPVPEASAQQTEPKVLVVTFSLYRDRESGAPLWSETQAVTLDAHGYYTVLLGATRPEGLPLDLFTSGQAKWLGAQPQLPGVGELPRELLGGAAYALKAADADTLGGKPASAYVTRDAVAATDEQAVVNGAATAAGQTVSTLQEPPAGTHIRHGASPDSSTITGSGSANYVPLWTSASTLGDSNIFQSGGNVGIATTTPAYNLQVSGTNSAVAGVQERVSNLATTGNSLSFLSADANKAQTVSIFAADGLGTGPMKTPSGYFGTYTSRPLGFVTGNVERMRVTTTGLVGVGTTAPAYNLQVAGNNTAVAGVQIRASNLASTGNSLSFLSADADNGKAVAIFAADGLGTGPMHTPGAYFGTYTDQPMGITTDNLERVRVTTSGQVGIGTTVPAATLEVNGTSKFDQAVTFAAGQTFPGTATLGANTFAGNQTVTGNVSASGSISGATGTFTGSNSGSILSATESGSGSAVYGDNTAASGSTVGIEGLASSSMGAGLLGRDASASTTGSQHPGYTGVWGDSGVAGNDGVLATTDDGFAMVAYNNSPSLDATLFAEALSSTGGPIIKAVSGTNSCYIDTNANLFCTGSKSAVVHVDDGRHVALYAVEAPENWFEDFGTGTLIQGVAEITLDPVFAQTVNAGMEYHVFLTPKGDCEGLYVTGETPTGFEVHELRHGRSSVAFDYRIVARRKGYEGIRLADKTKDMETPTPNLPGRRVASLPELHRGATVSSPR